MQAYIFFSCFLLLWLLSLIITAKLHIKEFNSKASQIFIHELKSIIILAMLFIPLYLMLPSVFKTQYLFSRIFIIFVFADIITTIMVVIFGKNKNSQGFFNKSLSSGQRPLSSHVSIGATEITKDIGELPGTRSLYKDEIVKLIKQCCGDVVNLNGPIEVLTEDTTIQEYQNNVGLLLVTRPANNTRHLNKTLLDYYNSISDHGLLVSRYKSFDQAKLYKLLRRNLLSKYALYPLYFFFTRALPKIPILEKGYFFFTNNKYKTISKAEYWGRLHYSGFEVLGERECHGQNIVLARKSYTPSLNKNPSYYPVIKLRRVGLGGKIVMIFKIRSMFPYSEYIQKKVFESEKLSSIGKFSNDFRITGYGRFIRKYYIDEIFQIINYLRGDIKLVGIRAMSEHYFSLYPDNYKKLYCQVKPGFLSPLPEKAIESFNDVVNLEKEYLDQYLQAPISTDVKYFFKIVYQLIFKRRVSS